LRYCKQFAFGMWEGVSVALLQAVRFLGCERAISFWDMEGDSEALRRNRFFGVIGAIACNNVIITASKI